MRIAVTILYGLSISVAGCTSLETRMDRLATAKSCCNGPHEFQYKNLPPSGELSLDISAETLVFDFPSGRSHFEAIRVAHEEFAKIRIRIDPEGPNFPSQWQFCPSVTFLTAKHETIHTVYEPPRWHFVFMKEAFYVVDHDIPAGTVYAVIHSEARRAGESLSRVVSIPSGGNSFLIVVPIQLLSRGTLLNKTERTPCYPTGSIRISGAASQTAK